MPSSSSSSRRPREVGGYRLSRKLGEGSFGEVFRGRRNGKRVAVKLERLEKVRKARLPAEAGLVMQLQGPGIPRVYWSGKLRKYNAMAMEELGPSLEAMFRRCKKRLPLRTALMCADQLIERLQHVHGRGILHRDMKPQNFLIGLGEDANKVYLVDFGLSKTYLDPKTGKHIPFKDGRTGLTGTARYTSINNHNGIEPTRRDDLEGLGYVLLHLLRGSLPWQSIKADTKQERNARIKAAKLGITYEELCKGLPVELVEYMKTLRRVAFDETPPYEALRDLMRRAIARTPSSDRTGAPEALDWGAARASSEASSSSSCTSSDYSTTRSTSATSSTADTGHGAAKKKRKR